MVHQVPVSHMDHLKVQYRQAICCTACHSSSLCSTKCYQLISNTQKIIFHTIKHRWFTNLIRLQLHSKVPYFPAETRSRCKAFIPLSLQYYFSCFVRLQWSQEDSWCQRLKNNKRSASKLVRAVPKILTISSPSAFRLHSFHSQSQERQRVFTYGCLAAAMLWCDQQKTSKYLWNNAHNSFAAANSSLSANSAIPQISTKQLGKPNCFKSADNIAATPLKVVLVVGKIHINCCCCYLCIIKWEMKCGRIKPLICHLLDPSDQDQISLLVVIFLEAKTINCLWVCIVLSFAICWESQQNIYCSVFHFLPGFSHTWLKVKHPILFGSCYGLRNNPTGL